MDHLLSREKEVENFLDICLVFRDYVSEARKEERSLKSE
jgi:hypothetical protein